MILEHSKEGLAIMWVKYGILHANAFFNYSISDFRKKQLIGEECKTHDECRIDQCEGQATYGTKPGYYVSQK